MQEFIIKYWLEVLFSGILFGLGVLLRMIFSRMKKEFCEQKILKEGVLALLHDRIYQYTDFLIQKGTISVDEFDNLQYLYASYKALGGNGTGKVLYDKCVKIFHEGGI